MNLQELDSYNLADAVKFNKTLNPRLWQKEQMRPEVRDKLLEIAADFKEFLGLSDLEVKDITVSGSNAGYTYTPYSDIDLHLVVDIPQADSDDVYRELFDAKKYQYNDLHNIKIGGYDVELYVENANKPPVSQGVFSVLNNDWINIPRYRKSTVDDDAVRSKYEDFKHRIDDAVKSNDMERIDSLAKKIKTYRQAGLDAHGELGPENLAYKMLRTQGYITKLYDARAAARDAELSLAEQNKVKKPFVYGYKSVAEDVTSTPDGVGASTRMFLSEKPTPTQEEIIRDFLNFVVEKLNIDQVPKLRLKKDPTWSIRNHSFGRYDNATGELIVALGNRHIMDVLRTLAHELTHRKQDEREDMPADAGETGSSYENEANAQAGVLMRDYAELHPEYFQDATVAESSGYIPTAAQAADPRFKMALTVDVHPGQTGREANKMALKTNKQGKPGLLMKTANMIGEASNPKSYGYNSKPLSQVPGEREDELGNQEATGPEFEPQFPPGTTKVDVSDLTDWYRLGMDISDMDDADPEDYNQGPPQTVIVFPSDEAEQGYLKQFKRLGLKTHDLDPDVKGGEDVTGKHLNRALAEELQAFKTQDLFEVKMTSKNLAKLAQDIKGVKVGLEFEMIVPNASVEDSDMEPDYEQDERVRDIDDAVNFFDDGDYNGRAEIRRLREAMEEDFHNWQFEQMDEAWDNNGFEFFQEYLDREEPFDPEDYQERAEDEIKAEFPEMDPESEDFGELVAEKLREINAEYYTESWEAQGRSYDRAREEFEEEQRDNFTESDWLDSQSIRYASDIESQYGHVSWPYYTSGSDEEADIERVALDFMNGIGADTVAYSSSYHGSYKKWTGNGWVLVGNEKPDDCFSIEPDGSLDGNSRDDVGLEFVSPPIPLEDIGTVMKKVQNWAGEYGVYTGKNNKTSIHTNISVPGYDLDKLDYLKAALLLGDEHVLREFDRIGNSYAKPAIEKVKQLVQQKPEKAQELLDKMKSQLNAEASKLIHSGVTDKFTSINTKNNRVEFRSPGGDYLSIIADNPQKMVDTINRMVVTLDAAMNPDKYKQEYQKKLYKVLTGQGGGREAATGKKQEMKASDKDLLNIFSRYAAGELPKQALKSFVRQAQLERNIEKGKQTGKMWWRVGLKDNPNYGIEVVGSTRAEAIQAAKEANTDLLRLNAATDFTAKPIRPYEEKPEAQQPAQQGSGTYRITTTGGGLIAGDEYGDDQTALQRAQYWAQRRGVDVIVRNPQGEEVGRVSASGEITPTTQTQQPAQQQEGNWGIWITSSNRFVRQPGQIDNSVLRRFPSREDAEQFLAQTRAERPDMRNDIEVREIDPAEPIPGSTQDLQRQRAAQQGVDTTRDYEIYNRENGNVMTGFQARNDDEALARLTAYRGERGLNDNNNYGVRRGPGVTNTAPQSSVNNLTPHGPGPWEVANRENNQAYYNTGHTQRAAAETEARTWLTQHGFNPAEFEVRTREGVSRDTSQFGAARGAPNWEIVRDRDQEVVHRMFADNQNDAIGQQYDFIRMQGWNPNEYTLQAADAAQGGIVDVAGDNWSAEFERRVQQPATAPRTLTVPGQPQQQFTGEWKIVMPDGREVYRFGGVGNAQADANRVAMDWLMRNRQYMQSGAEVLPVMG